MNELTAEEINNLLAALLVWEKEPGAKTLQNSLFGVMMSGIGIEDETARRESQEQAKRKADAEFANAAKEESLRREASICLQAKLIQMRSESYK